MIAKIKSNTTFLLIKVPIDISQYFVYVLSFTANKSHSTLSIW